MSWVFTILFDRKRTNTSLRCDMCGTFRQNKRECQNMTIPKLDPPPKKPKVMTSTKKKNTATSTSKQTQPSNTQQSHTQPPKTSNMHTPLPAPDKILKKP